MDRRVRKSREALKGALLELLSRQSLHEIQVKQLCEAADVNRSTFYNNYSDINDILIDIYKDDIHIITSQVIDLTKAAAKDDTQEELIQAVCRAVQYFQENDQYFLLLFSQPTKARFEELLYMHYLKHYNLEQMELKQRYYFLQRIVGGFCIIRAWMAEGYPISAEELAHFLVEEVMK